MTPNRKVRDAESTPGPFASVLYGFAGVTERRIPVDPVVIALLKEARAEWVARLTALRAA
jgi:hypothetical protein